MECNKDEAIRAKAIAESKMQNNDFQGAHKIALKAQRLYTDLENISQLLCVCDVHCSAEKKVFGNERDWYGILQVEQTADEATIKKQYRKFALQLHPDKNKFPGAQAAFLLVGEAQKVLVDKDKRSSYDMKCRVTVSKPASHYRPPQRTNGSNFGSQSNVRSNFTDVNSQRQQQSAPQQGPTNGRPTFWTACPFCNTKFQYYVEVRNRSISCQTCKKSFTAYERSMHVGPNVAPFPQKKDAVPQDTSKVELRPQKKDAVPQHTSKVELRHKGDFSAGPSANEFYPKKGPTPEFRAEKVNGKRQRKSEESEESDESCDTGNSNDSEEMDADSEEMDVDEDGDFKAGLDSEGKEHVTRRSVRQKQQVSYKENHSDDDGFVNQPKVSKGSQSSSPRDNDTESGFKEEAAKTDEQVSDAAAQNGVKEEHSPSGLTNGKKETKTNKESVEMNGCQKSSETLVDSPAEVDDGNYPDPDFNDFDKIRNRECFSVGQTWALYDTLNAMPRFYAQVRKVWSSEFKLRVTWLEADPDGMNEIEWVKADLPTSCGKFKSGNNETLSDRLAFSHQIDTVESSQRGSVKILPRKGSTWALFKNWDIMWKSHRVEERKHEYEYEFVEVLDDYAEDVGLRVAFLGKVKGFVSVFSRINREGKSTHQIPPGELLRFSHMVPSFKLTGEEGEGVPKDSLELDTLSLPNNIEEITLEGFGLNASKSDTGGECSSSSGDDKNVSEDDSASSSSSLDIEALEVPDPEFFDFDAAKSPENIKSGQVWALYSDEDGLPKYYALIKSIQRNKVHIKWFYAWRSSRDIVPWSDKDMPVSCGVFKARSKSISYTDTKAFSHQVNVKQISTGDMYVISPKKGEIWALYRNWSSELTVSDLKNCKYDIVEVVEESNLYTRVKLLEHVKGFNSVFKPMVNGRTAVTMGVIRPELSRFSHQLPAFQLTDQRDGTLRGFWEVDAAALPVHLLFSK